MKKTTILLTILFCLVGTSFAETINLRNGDRITGKITKKDKDVTYVDTKLIGTVIVKNKSIKKAPPPKKEKKWRFETSVGYNRSRGNTNNDQVAANILVNRKTKGDEFTVKGNLFFSSSNDQTDAERWYNMVRYAFSFGKKKWFNYYKLETDHDRFADIEYRIIPSVGLGHWFSDKEHWKAMVEFGCGYEYVKWMVQAGVKKDYNIVSRVFVEKQIFQTSKISEDLNIYPSVNDITDYRIHSETAFTNALAKNLSLKISAIDDYTSKTMPGTDKNDLRLMTFVTYTY